MVESVAILVEARSPGWSARTTILLPVRTHDLRLSLEPDLADRRGLVD